MSTHKDYETRRQAAFRRLGTDHPVCVICGCADWRCLELHHIAGQKHHGDLAIVCRNCHRILSDDQCDHPPVLEEDSIIGRYLIGLADLLAMIASRLKEFGLFLIEMAEGNPPKSGRAG
jgi:hypothetical protein